MSLSSLFVRSNYISIRESLVGRKTQLLPIIIDRLSRVMSSKAATDGTVPVGDLSHSEGTQDEQNKRPQFGNRFLTGEKNVFEHNAWDNVEWDEEQTVAAEGKIAENSEVILPNEKIAEYETDADRFWHEFYEQHQNRFFKDRHWLFTEFPELAPNLTLEKIPRKVNVGEEKETSVTSSPVMSAPVTSAPVTSAPQASAPVTSAPQVSAPVTSAPQASAPTTSAPGPVVSAPVTSSDVYPGCNASYRVWEVGCGVGNTVFPVLQTNDDPGLFVYCCDFAKSAIQLVKEHNEYNEKRCYGFVYDLTDETTPLPFPDRSIDVIVLIFVLSAIHPDKMQSSINRLSRCLKPGGLIVFRDYGRYDLAQLRFKKGRCLSDNFYVRGDGTRVYFFTQDELRDMFTKAGLVEEQNLVDRRLQVNRGRQLKMYRVWVQCKYRKPSSVPEADNR
ncbi:tRNA N(3)-cytidine methyltransferase METTL2-like [Tubulanus polymorphus]|uniref:tRNA N(3)-cytidine methyltransferase METTL2-like n=1 Tax=Tubulanus polymorphus TaxID=672921 RepID=UPI003DA56557